ncbi:MAG: BACON domain-containing carbohydrate-binding protein [Proteiniphilum sp.]
MKKTLFFLLVLFGITCFVSCGDDGDTPVEDPVLTLGMPDGSTLPQKLEFSSDADSKKLNIASNGEWKITKTGTSTDWLTVSPESGQLNGTITLTAAKNSTTSNRDVVLVFSLGDKSSFLSYTVSQLAFGPALSVTPVEPEIVTEAGGNVTFTITTNADEWQYEVEGEPEWVTEESKNASSLTLALGKNVSAERSAKVTFKLKDYPTVTQVVTIVQSAFEPTLSVTPAQPETVPVAGGDLTFTIATNADQWQYEITGNPEWVTEKSKNGTSLTLTLAKNPAAERSAKIVFKLNDYQDVSQEVTITQAENVEVLITLSAPANAFSTNLSAKSEIEFKWEGKNVTQGYKLLISPNSNLSNAVTRNISEASTKVLPYELDALLRQGGVPSGQSITLYWSVEPQSANEQLTTPADVRTLTATRRVDPTIAADMLDVAFFLDGSAIDLSPMKHTVKTVSYSDPFTNSFNDQYNRSMVSFNPPQNGTSLGAEKGSYYRIDYMNNSEFKDKLANGHSFECLVQFDVDYASEVRNYETKFFSTHEQGGTGFLIANSNQGTGPNGLTFLPNVPAADGGASTWKWANSQVKPDGSTWYHLVGVWDKDLGKAYIYIDGELKSEIDAAGFYRPPVTLETFGWVAIGGDAGNNIIQNPFKGSLAIARIYDKALNATEVQTLWNYVK